MGHDVGMAPFHAIVLAGGRASRLGGIDKVLIRHEGRELLSRAVDAAAGAERVAIVGPHRDVPFARAALWVREDPPFSGPAHAVAAGLSALGPGDDDRVLVLAADLIRPELVVRDLLAGPGNRVAVDPTGRRQWACSLVRAGDLAAAIARMDTAGAPLKALIGGLDPADVPVSAEAGADLDTPDDLKEYADDER